MTQLQSYSEPVASLCTNLQHDSLVFFDPAPRQPYHISKDTESWRPGRIIAAKSNGLFAVQYDSEKGRPKEDRIAEARLRFRDAPRSIHVGNGDDRGDINSRHSANTGVITEGDVVLARGKGRGGEESAMATVVKMTADNILVMEYLDGSGTFKAEPAQVRYVHPHDHRFIGERLLRASEGGGV